MEAKIQLEKEKNDPPKEAERSTWRLPPEGGQSGETETEEGDPIAGARPKES